jgi:hypothetical protein
MFGSQPLLTITGAFYGDEHTKPGVTGLNVQFGGGLSIVKNVFSALQTLAQFLPGGATAALDVALSDGTLTVTDTFTIADMPLGLGERELQRRHRQPRQSLQLDCHAAGGQRHDDSGR